MFFREQRYQEEDTNQQEKAGCSCGQKEDAIEERMRRMKQKQRDEEMAAKYQKIRDDMELEKYRQELGKKYDFNNVRWSIKWFLIFPAIFMIFCHIMEQVEKNDHHKRKREYMERRARRAGYNGPRTRY